MIRIVQTTLLATITSFMGMAHAAPPPCLLPPGCEPGSFTIEIMVFPGGSSAEPKDVRPMSLTPHAKCMAKHADYFFPHRPKAFGRYYMPVTVPPIQCRRRP